MYKMLIGILTSALLLGCGEDSIERSVSSKSSPNLKSSKGNSEQNSYSNENLGIAFSYPLGWTLSEDKNSNSIQVFNSQANGQKNTSYLEFSLTKDFFNQALQTQSQLLESLKTKWPSKKWKPISFNAGQQGFIWKAIDEFDWHTGEYHLLDKNYNILSISYRATVNLGGVGVIKGIVSSMTVDNIAPNIKRVYFDPPVAHPGERVNIVIEADDNIGDISIITSTTDNCDEDQCPYDTQLSWGGQVGCFEDNCMVYGGIWNGYTNIYPKQLDYINSGINRSSLKTVKTFAQTSDGVFKAEVLIPINAPEGNLEFTEFAAADEFNIVTLTPGTGSDKYTLEVGSAETILSSEQQIVSRPLLKIVRNEQAGTPDLEAPQLKRVWFEKTILPAGELPKLYMEIEDRSDIRQRARVRLGGSVFASNKLVKERPGLYSISFKNFRCNKYRDNVTVTELYLVDEIGNIFHGNRQSGTLLEASFISLGGHSCMYR